MKCCLSAGALPITNAVVKNQMGIDTARRHHLRGLFLFGAFAACASNAQAAEGASLPELPIATATASGRLNFNQQGATFDYGTRTQKLVARTGYSTDVKAILYLDYGTILTDTLAAGANLAYGNRYKEVLLNGAYAPVQDIRLRITAGQLRRTSDYQFISGNEAIQVSQNNYYLDAKKYWDKGTPLSDIGLTAYSTRASEPSVGEKSLVKETGTLTQIYIDPRRLATGTLQGAMFNIGLRPIAKATLELGLGTERLTYRFSDGTQEQNNALSSQVKYTQYFDNCMRFKADYNGGAAMHRLGLSVGKDGWNVGVARTLGRNGNGGDFMLSLGYAVYLDKANQHAACRFGATGTRASSSILGDVTTRPAQLPTVALARVDPTAKPILIAEFDKTQIAAGVNVTATSATSLVVNLQSSVGAIAAVELDGITVSNAGPNGGPLFAIDGSNLRVLLQNFGNLGTGVRQNYTVTTTAINNTLARIQIGIIGN